MSLDNSGGSPVASDGGVGSSGMDISSAFGEAQPKARDCASSANLCCWSCRGLVRPPTYQLSCGCRLCRHPCLDEFRRSVEKEGKTKVTCPSCRELLAMDQCHADVCADREVQSVIVLCRAREQGCRWEGQLSLYRAHHAGCGYATVPCSNPGCSVMVQRQLLTQHTLSCAGRVVHCPHCSWKMLFRDLARHTGSACQEMGLDCPNSGCDAVQIKRKELQEHRRTCRFERVRCDFTTSGCEYIGLRQTLAAHYERENAYHMLLLNQAMSRQQTSPDVLAEVRRENAELKSDFAELKQNYKALQKTASEQTSFVSITLNDLEKLKTENERLRHEVSELCVASQKERDRASHMADRLDKMAADMEKRRRDEQAQGATGVSGPRAADIDRVQSEVVLMKKVLTDRVDAMERSVTVQDLQLSDLTIRQDLSEVKGCNGVLVWRISDLRRRYEEAKCGRTPSLYSPPFYSSSAGYKMCARLYLHGDGSGKGSHVSLFFVIMRGDYDALLPWPFQQKVKMTLIDQTPTASGADRFRGDIVEVFRPNVASSSFQRPCSEMNIATGCPLFAPKSVLLSEQYVREDSIFIRIEMSLTGLKPPDLPAT